LTRVAFYITLKSMSEAKRSGRPPGREFPVVKQIRLGEVDAAQLAVLSDVWACSEAAAVRRAIHVAARGERVLDWRAAAERMRAYYATDSEVAEWQAVDDGVMEYPVPTSAQPPAATSGSRRRRRQSVVK
jgi:hypothetical protein